MKLGFLVTKTIEGAGKGRPINDGLWRQYAVDIRSLTDGLNDFVGTGKDVVLLRFLGKEGFLVGVVITEVGRPRDNTTAWIHVPAGMKISGEELESTINAVKEEARKKLVGLDDIRESCRRFFEKDYSQKNVSVTAVGRVRSKGIDATADVRGESDGGNPSAREKEEVAGLYYGEGEDFQLYELLGDYVAQSEYSKWAGIFLIDRKSEISVRNVINSSSLKKTVIFSLAQPEYGFNASYGNPEFNGSVEVLEGEQIDIIWSRKGYQNVQKSIKVNKFDEENRRQAQILPHERKYGVNRSWFKVRDENGTDISAKCSVKVNGNELRNGNEPTYISAVEEYEVVISCRGYKTEEGEREFTSKYSSLGNQIIYVRLKADMIEKEYILPIDEADGLKNEAKVRIETKYPDDPDKKMPIIGYELDDGKMVYNDFKSAWARIKWFLIGFLVMAAIWGVSAGTKWLKGNCTFDSKLPFIHRKVETPKKEKPAPNKGNSEGNDGNEEGDGENNVGNDKVVDPNDEGSGVQALLNGGMDRNDMTYSLLS